jgi:hypothetical protein
MMASERELARWCYHAAPLPSAKERDKDDGKVPCLFRFQSSLFVGCVAP